MRCNKEHVKKDDTPSRPVGVWAGVSLFTYKKIKPWVKTEEKTCKESTSVSFGAALIGLQLTAPNVVVDKVKSVTNSVTEKALKIVAMVKRTKPALAEPVESAPQVGIPEEKKPQQGNPETN
jgi:hypothetical protein